MGDAASVSTIVDSQIGIIKSDSIGRAVIRKLNLVKTPEFIGQTGGVRSTIYSIARSIGLMKPETEEAAARIALETFQSKFSVKRDGLTYIVGISFESIDPRRAALILNTIAETYISQQMDAKYNYTLRDETWVKDQLNELSNQASAARKALEDFKNRDGLAGSADAGADGAQPELTAQMQGELRALTAAAEASASALDGFRHRARFMEATRQQSLPVFDARLLTEVIPPLRPSSPKGGMVLGIASVLGVLLGIAICVVARAFESRRPEQRTSRKRTPDILYRGCPNGQFRQRSGKVDNGFLCPCRKATDPCRKAADEVAKTREPRRFPAKWSSIHCQVINRRIQA